MVRNLQLQQVNVAQLWFDALKSKVGNQQRAKEILSYDINGAVHT